MRTATVKAMMEPEKKKKATEILKRAGVTHSEWINMVYSLLIENGAIPLGFEKIKVEEKDDQVMKHAINSMNQNDELMKLLAK